MESSVFDLEKFKNSLQDNHVIDMQAYQLSTADLEYIYQWLIRDIKVAAVGRIRWHLKQNKNDSILKKIEELLKMRRITYQNRASPYVYAILSQQVYKNDGGNKNLPKGWEVYKKSGNGSNPDGYFGVAYRNVNMKHIIIAHRGTKSERLKALLKDINQDMMGIIQNRVTRYEASAYAFSEDMIREAIGNGYQISFTGHSLGGWLAQVCTYQAIKQKYYTFAIVFDSPGVREKLESHEARIPSTEQVVLNNLDITIYLSVPNLVNTCHTHLGSVYRLYPVLPKFVFYKPSDYLLETHNIERLINCFDVHSGFPIKHARVIDWPRIDWKIVNPNSTLFRACISALVDLANGIKVEYNGFQSFANKENEYDPNQNKYLSGDDKYFLENAYHYKVEQNTNVLEIDCRHLSADVFNFLMKYQNNSHKIDNLTELPAIKKLGISLELSDLNYKIEPYPNGQGYTLKLTDAKNSYNVYTFQNKISSLITYYKELKYLDYDNYFRHLLVGHSKHWELPLIRQDIQQQRQDNMMLLLKLAALQSQPRLYLYGESTDDERIEVNEQEILIISRLNANDSLLKELDKKLNDDNGYWIEEITNFKNDLQIQRLQLQFALKMNQILLYQRFRRYADIKDSIEKIFEDIEKLNEVDKRQLFFEHFSENKLRANLYNLQAKIYRILLSKSEWEKVKYSYDLAIHNDSQNAILYSSKGAFMNDWGKHTEAIDLHRKAEYLDSYQAIVLSNLGWGIYQLSKEKGNLLAHANEIALYYEKSLKIKKYLAGTWYYQGLLKRDQGNIQGTLEDFKKALEIQPGHPKVLYYRAQLFFEQKNYEKCLSDVGRAKFSLYPNIPDHHELLILFDKLEKEVRIRLGN